jgi:hypothetical protein
MRILVFRRHRLAHRRQGPGDSVLIITAREARRLRGENLMRQAIGQRPLQSVTDFDPGSAFSQEDEEHRSVVHASPSET